MFLFRSALSIYEKFYPSLNYSLGPDLIYPAQGEPHCDRSPSTCIALITVLNHSVPERQSLVA